MKVYTLDIDSGERDTAIYPNPSAYTVYLKTPVYNVSNIEVVSVRIPTPRVINAYNNTFTVRDINGSYDVHINPLDSNISNTSQFSAYVTTLISNAGCNTINSVQHSHGRFIFSNTNASHNFSLNFYSGTNGWTSNNISYTTPNQLFGFPAIDATSTNSVLVGGESDLVHPPKTFVLKISSGSSGFHQDIYTVSPFYTGVFMNNETDTNAKPYMLFKSQDDMFRYEYNTGPQKEINSLTFEWYHKENNKLIPIDFKNRDHAIKLTLHGNKDKLESLPKVDRKTDLPPPISIPELENPYRWKEYASIALIVFVGLIALMLTKRKPRIPIPITPE